MLCHPFFLTQGTSFPCSVLWNVIGELCPKFITQCFLFHLIYSRMHFLCVKKEALLLNDLLPDKVCIVVHVFIVDSVMILALHGFPDTSHH